MLLSLPNIQWDGHNSVENDDVGPEGEEARENSTTLEVIPWQECLEVFANAALPNSVSNPQNDSHTKEEDKDLTNRSSFYVNFEKWLYPSITKPQCFEQTLYWNVLYLQLKIAYPQHQSVHQFVYTCPFKSSTSTVLH